MATFFVTYDLMKQKDYPKLWDRLQRYYGAKRVLLSVWVLKGHHSARGIRDDLTNYIDSDDKLLVIESIDWAGLRLMVSPNDM